MMVNTILEFFKSPLFDNPLVLFIASVAVTLILVLAIDVVAKIYKAVASLSKKVAKINRRIEFVD